MASAALSRDQLAVSHMEATQTRILPMNQQPLRLLSLDDMAPMGMREAVRETLKEHLTPTDLFPSPDIATQTTNTAPTEEDGPQEPLKPTVFGKLSPAAEAAEARFMARDFTPSHPMHANDRSKRDLLVGAGLVCAVIAINIGLALASASDEQDASTPTNAVTAAAQEITNEIDPKALPNAADLPVISPQMRMSSEPEKSVTLPSTATTPTTAANKAPSNNNNGFTSLAAPSYITHPETPPAAPAMREAAASNSTPTTTLPSRAAVQELLAILKK